jgi:predicted transcriptional regulator
VPGTTATIRIREETHETLKDLRRQTGEPTPDIVARAVDQFYRSLLIAETNCGYAAARESGEPLEELDVLEGSLADGLD